MRAVGRLQLSDRANAAETNAVENPDADAERQLIEKNRLQRADVVIAVISSPIP